MIVPNGPAIRGHAADLAGSEVRDGYLRRWLSLGEIRQMSIVLPLMRALLVVVAYSANIRHEISTPS